MKARTFFLGVLGGAIALFLVGIAALVGLTAQSPLGLLRATPAPLTARWVPRQAPLMVSLLVRPDRLWDLRQVLLPADRRFRSRQEWQGLQTWLRQATGVDYLQDLRPWLGDEITFAITSNDLDGDGDNGLQPGYLLVLTSRDGEQVREALYRFWQQRALGGEEVTLEPQGGLTLIYNQLVTANPGQGGLQRVASALVGQGEILMANDPQVLRQAIATSQAPDVSLASDPTYRRLVKALPPGSIGWMYGTLPATLGWLEDQPPLPPTAPRTDVQRAFLSWQLKVDRDQPAQLIADTTLARRPGAAPLPPPDRPLDGSALRWLPADTTLALSGPDLVTLWQQLQQGVQGYGLTAPLIAPLERLALGILPQEESPDSPDSPLPPAISLWAGQGPYALGWLAQSQDWIWVTTPLNAPQGEAPNLDAQAQAQGWGVGRVTLGQTPVTVWTQLAIAPDSPPDSPRLTTQVLAVHAPVGNPAHPQELYATSLAALQAALTTQPQTALLGQPLITQALATPNPHTLLYLNWPHWQATLGQATPLSLLNPVINPSTAYLGPMVALTQPPTPTQTQARLWISLRNP